jgi:uncharacterized membrane protein YhhN
MSKNMSVTFFVFALVYMVGLHFDFDFLWLLKIIPIALLGVGVLKTESSLIRSMLLLALSFSACGDLLLAFDLFIYGVAAFLLAQLSYAVIFREYWKGFFNRWPYSMVLIIYMLTMGWLLVPNLGDLQIPVMAYLIAIAAMGFLAVLSSLPIRWAVLGAVLFIISDSFIAINKFISPFPFESYWIMSSYYAAQFMLVTGFINAGKQQK